jgi:hypothetical protein
MISDGKRRKRRWRHDCRVLTVPSGDGDATGGRVLMPTARQCLPQFTRFTPGFASLPSVSRCRNRCDRRSSRHLWPRPLQSADVARECAIALHRQGGGRWLIVEIRVISGKSSCLCRGKGQITHGACKLIIQAFTPATCCTRKCS